MTAPLPAWGPAAAPAILPSRSSDRDATQRRKRRPAGWQPNYRHKDAFATSPNPDGERLLRDRLLLPSKAATTLKSVFYIVRNGFPRQSLLFRTAMLRVREAARAIQRSFRSHLWRRNAMLEAYLSQWCDSQGMVSAAELSERWRRNNAYVRKLHGMGVSAPSSKNPKAFLETMLRSMEDRRLDKGLMMEVLMQGYLDARNNYFRWLRFARKRDDKLQELPSFMRSIAGRGEVPGVMSFSSMSAAWLDFENDEGKGDGGYDFSLEECQTRYATLSHMYQEQRVEETLASQNRAAEATAQFTAFADAAAGQESVDLAHASAEDPLSIGDFSGTAAFRATETAVYEAVPRLQVEAPDAEAPASFVRDASMRALAHVGQRKRAVKFIGQTTTLPTSYDSMPSTGPHREEKMLWTNDLSRYAKIRKLRDDELLTRARRASQLERVEEAVAKQRRRSSLRPSPNPSRRSSVSAERTPAGSTRRSSARSFDGNASPNEVEPSTATQLHEAPPSPIPEPPSDAVDATAAKPNDPGEGGKRSDARRLAPSASRGAATAAEHARAIELRRNLVPAEELAALTPRSRHHRLRAAERDRRNATQRRHKVAAMPTMACVPSLRTSSGAPRSVAEYIRSTRKTPHDATAEPDRSNRFGGRAVAQRLRSAMATDARARGLTTPATVPRSQRTASPRQPKPSRGAQRLLGVRPATADGGSRLAERRVDRGLPQRPLASASDVLIRPPSAAVSRLPPYRVRDAVLGQSNEKLSRTYSNAEHVARLLGAPAPASLAPAWIATVSAEDAASDARLEALCQRVAKGDAGLENALRREWRAFASASSPVVSAASMDDIVQRAESSNPL